MSGQYVCMKIVRDHITMAELKEMSQVWHGELVKAVVDVLRNIMAVDGEMHADEEQILLLDGSKQEYLWGINIYLGKEDDSRIEFDSMINVRPSQQNMSRSVEDKELQKTIRSIIDSLIVK